jgi:hypothetical protein
LIRLTKEKSIHTEKIQQRWREYDLGESDRSDFEFIQSLSRYKNPSPRQCYWIARKACDCFPDEYTMAES